MTHNQAFVTASDRVYFGLRDMIASGELKSGTRLVQRELAKRFGTSNIPVVEAIRRLERDSLVVCQSNWGALVKEWLLEDIEGVYLLREVLEGTTCRLFAERATEPEMSALRDYARQFNELALAQNPQACNAADVAIHMHIVKCCRSATLAQLVENSYIIVATITNNNIRPSSEPAELLGPPGIHDELIAALCSRNPEAAEQAAREHIRYSARKFLNRLKKQKRNREVAIESRLTCHQPVCRLLWTKVPN